MDDHTGAQNNQISLTPLFDFGLIFYNVTHGYSWTFMGSKQNNGDWNFHSHGHGNGVNEDPPRK